MKPYVITLSRQFASMGRAIAQSMSGELGINFYDRDIVEETAKRLGLSVSYVSKVEETGASFFTNLRYPLGMGLISTQKETFEIQSNITFNAEYRDSRTLTLNSAAGQLVEASSKSLVVGGSYKIANFNSILKLRGKQQGINHDLTINADFTLSNNNALIRKIESNTAQATSGTRTVSINVTADYVLSKRLTVGAYFDHQINTPLVSSTAYPTSNTNFGISINLSLTR